MRIFGKNCGGTAALTKTGWEHRCRDGKKCELQCEKEKKVLDKPQDS